MPNVPQSFAGWGRHRIESFTQGPAASFTKTRVEAFKRLISKVGVKHRGGMTALPALLLKHPAGFEGALYRSQCPTRSLLQATWRTGTDFGGYQSRSLKLSDLLADLQALYMEGRWQRGG